MLLMGKSSISMAIFNSYVSLPEGILCYPFWLKSVVFHYFLIVMLTKFDAPWPMIVFPISKSLDPFHLQTSTNVTDQCHSIGRW